MLTWFCHILCGYRGCFRYNRIAPECHILIQQPTGADYRICQFHLRHHHPCLVFLLQDSKFGPNKYGESPKYVTVDDQAAGAKAEQSDFDKGIEKVGDTIDNIAEAAQDKAEDLAGKAKESASDLVDKAKDVAEKAKDSAGDFVEKAKDSAENLVDKAKDVAENVADKAKDAAENVADKAKDLTEKAKDAID